MSHSTFWARGRYDAVGDRIAGIANRVVSTADRRVGLRDAAVVDLGCGTGTASLAAAGRGARVTGVDLTPELIELAESRCGDRQITWVVGDAAETGLADGGFDAVISNMGIIFVDPGRQVAELARLLKPGGVLSYSSWVRAEPNPIYDPVAAVFGAPATGFAPDQWGDPPVVQARLSDAFGQIEIENHSHTWQFDSLAATMDFLTDESPIHVAAFALADEQQNAALRSGFEAALAPYVGADGAVSFESPYVVVSAIALGQRGGATTR